jgi:transglutaminase/protease-like cytokinesis protein 3
MKILLVILLFYPLCFYAQSKAVNYYDIDRRVASIPIVKADSLAKQLAALGKTDHEKVRAIFRWIAEHIDYNVKAYKKNKATSGLFYEEPEDSSAALPSLNERVAAKVLYKRMAFCDGYSRLFKTLCDHAGIQSEIVNGYARTGSGNRRFAVNHTWNAVYFDSAWHLLDATWAAGFISYANEYVRSYNDSYFLTPPADFIRDHYPEDPQWTLLGEAPVYREFSQSPFRYSGFAKSGVSSYFPVKGIIEASVGDTIKIEMKANREIRNFLVTESPVADSLQLQQSVHSQKSDKVSFAHTFTGSEWLYVFCNDELVMRYKTNIKKDAAINNKPRQ